MSEINQKEYLKRYLSKDEKKSKRRKKAKAVTSRVKIIDDDLDSQIFTEAVQDDLQEAEDAPQIVAIIDDRPAELRTDVFLSSTFKPITIVKEEINSDTETCNGNDYSPSRVKDEKDDENDYIREFKYDSVKDEENGGYEEGRRNFGRNGDTSPARKSEHSPPGRNDDTSPPRKQRKDDYSPPKKLREDDDHSPPRRNRTDDTSPPRKLRKDDDHSPPRRNRNDDCSPPRKQRKDDDHSPPRRSRFDDNSPPRRSRSGVSSSPRKIKNEDASPPRKNRKDDSSPPRRNRNGDGSRNAEKQRKDDSSPPRKNRKDDNSPPRRRRGGDVSPPKRSRDDESPPRRYKGSPSRKHRKQDDSPPRRNRRDSPNRSNRNDYTKYQKPDDSSPKRNRNSPFRGEVVIKKEKCLERTKSTESTRKSRWTSDAEPSKMTKTLDGKNAGLQNAKLLAEETLAMKRREEELFKSISEDVSGANAPTVMRNRKTGKIRDVEEENAEKQEKENREALVKEKYARWGKGCKQTDDYNAKLQQDAYEMNKPMARYADDEDLEKYKRDQEREGDPMLAHTKKKKKEIDEKLGIPSKPQYLGSFMPNRFGIRPGHKWDGVDRSNGYEKKLFEIQNARRAERHEWQQWNTEDM